MKFEPRLFEGTCLTACFWERMLGVPNSQVGVPNAHDGQTCILSKASLQSHHVFRSIQSEELRRFVNRSSQWTISTSFPPVSVLRVQARGFHGKEQLECQPSCFLLFKFGPEPENTKTCHERPAQDVRATVALTGINPPHPSPSQSYLLHTITLILSFYTTYSIYINRARVWPAVAR